MINEDGWFVYNALKENRYDKDLNLALVLFYPKQAFFYYNRKILDFGDIYPLIACGYVSYKGTVTLDGELMLKYSI